MVLLRPRTENRAWIGVLTLRIGFFSRDGTTVAASIEGDAVQVTIGTEQRRLSRAAAAELQSALAEALTERREFVRTAGIHRADGTYVVTRRGAESTGNKNVFDSYEQVWELYDQLPDQFTAEDVGAAGISGSRRHMIVRHLAEHPAFDCSLICRSPLRANKEGSTVDRTAGQEADAD